MVFEKRKQKKALAEADERIILRPIFKIMKLDEINLDTEGLEALAGYYYGMLQHLADQEGAAYKILYNEFWERLNMYEDFDYSFSYSTSFADNIDDYISDDRFPMNMKIYEHGYAALEKMQARDYEPVKSDYQALMDELMEYDDVVVFYSDSQWHLDEARFEKINNQQLWKPIRNELKLHSFANSYEERIALGAFYIGLIDFLADDLEIDEDSRDDEVAVGLVEFFDYSDDQAEAFVERADDRIEDGEPLAAKFYQLGRASYSDMKKRNFAAVKQNYLQLWQQVKQANAAENGEVESSSDYNEDEYQVEQLPAELEDFNEQLTDYVDSIYELASKASQGHEYQTLYFWGQVSGEFARAEFWFIDANEQYIFASNDLANYFDQLSGEVRSMSELFSENDMRSFQNMLITYTVTDDVDVNINFDYFDWLKIGFDDLDCVNYYVVNTVGSDYVRGTPDKKNMHLEQVYKMQEYAKTHDE
ncbi:hypothetical protein JOC36_001552 [Weissella uvarum]|uniref:hypothetical protein n=1 Tax=Weissella uvarum TaxID=1479233 RepID=UPI001960B2CC|nr:hypothetical protein [Weissella uvarum]MBM7617958.1 hypothetical protein [Weissella uvarum]MCM0596177.1 hypothetical protein [Weissella uvarum]